MSTNGVSDYDADMDQLYSFWPGTTPAPAPCPEALFSLTLKGRLGGQDALLTIRGQTAAEFQRNLAAVRGLLDAPQAPAPPAPQGDGWCAVHECAMKPTEKNGQRWWSHKTAQGWCKGKGR